MGACHSEFKLRGTTNGNASTGLVVGAGLQTQGSASINVQTNGNAQGNIDIHGEGGVNVEGQVEGEIVTPDPAKSGENQGEVQVVVEVTPEATTEVKVEVQGTPNIETSNKSVFESHNDIQNQEAIIAETSNTPTGDYQGNLVVEVGAGGETPLNCIETNKGEEVQVSSTFKIETTTHTHTYNPCEKGYHCEECKTWDRGAPIIVEGKDVNDSRLWSEHEFKMLENNRDFYINEEDEVLEDEKFSVYSDDGEIIELGAEGGENYFADFGFGFNVNTQATVDGALRGLGGAGMGVNVNVAL